MAGKERCQVLSRFGKLRPNVYVCFGSCSRQTEKRSDSWASVKFLESYQRLKTGPGSNRGCVIYYRALGCRHFLAEGHNHVKSRNVKETRVICHLHKLTIHTSDSALVFALLCAMLMFATSLTLIKSIPSHLTKMSHDLLTLTNRQP